MTSQLNTDCRSSRPSDPNAEFYLTNCFVCQEEAKPGQVHIRNYGAVVCLSCRAFWRRAHQKSRSPDYECRKDNDCLVDVKNRRACQKCRYERCLAAGMDPDAVLTEQQRQFRFRKAIERKNRLKSSEKRGANYSDSSPERSGELDHARPDPMSVEPPSFNRWTKMLEPKIEMIMKTYQAAMVHDDSSEKLFGKIDRIFNGDSKIEMGKIDIFENINKMFKEFERFANLQSLFCRLNFTNRKRLLERNTPLYIQLRLGSYLSKNPFSSNPKKANNFTNFKRLASQFKLFRPDANLEEYEQLLDQLQTVTFLNRPDQRSLLAYVVLFCCDDLIYIGDNESLEDSTIMNEIMFDTFVATKNNEFDMHDLSKVLIKMAIFCTYNMDWGGLANNVRKDSEVSMSRIVMTFTIEEEAWLNQQLHMVAEAFRSVPAGRDMLHEFLMYSLGVPLSRNHMPNVFKMLLERVRRVFGIHPEFEGLSVAVQRNLLMTRTSLALALTSVRSESLSGIEQIQEGIGELDETIWREDYYPVFDSPEKISKVSIQYCFTEDQWNEFSRLMSATRILFDHPEFYRLSLLFALTKPESGDDENADPLSNLHFKYKMILIRRLRWKQDWIDPSDGDISDPDMLVHKVFGCFELLNEVHNINQRMLNATPSP